MNQATAAGQRWFEAVESGDTERIEAGLTEDCDFRAPGGQFGTAHDAAEFASGFVRAFPDAKFTIDRWIEQEDVSVAEGRYQGTHTDVLVGPQGEIPPTGNSVSIAFASIFGEREGKVAFHHAYWDNAEFMMQLGVMPQPGG